MTTAKWTPAVSQTTVFYSKDSQAATAARAVKDLGFGKAEQTTKGTGGGIAVVAMPDADSVVP